MSYFNEDNVTEQMCIAVAKEAGYEYCGADELREAKNDVIVEPLLQEALVKINHITLDEALNVTLLYLIWLIVWFEYVNSELTLIV